MASCHMMMMMMMPLALPCNKIHTKKIWATKVVLPTITAESNQRHLQLKTFDDTKTGVKGLVDAGIAALPQIFVHPPHHLKQIEKTNTNHHFELPVIDLNGINADSHQDILDTILDASRSWGFFQLVNHGISISTLDETLDGIRRFHELAAEMKKPYYTRDFSRNFTYNSNFDLFSAPAACWRDTIFFLAAPNPPPPEELPQTCREILVQYSKEVMKVGITVFKLISEALGLDPNHLIDIECAQTLSLLGALLSRMS